MADLGLIGLLVTTLLFLAWLLAALSATGLVPRRLLRREGDATAPPRRDWDTHRIAIVTLALVPFVFGIQSLLDWTWFIQEPAVMALIPAGYLAGLGPFGEGVGRAAPASAERRIQWRPDAGRIVAALVAVATALLLAWAIWQPEASDRATNEALALLDEKKFDQAVAKTEDAEDLNPLTPDPLLVRASIETAANREADAQTSLERAVLLFPGDPQTWYRLAAFQLGTLDAPEQALETIRGALYLDPHSRAASQLFLDSRARQREKAGAADPGLNE
jgi:tetratricopeptide (TPR) repeat protein